MTAQTILQPHHFEFSSENLQKIPAIIAKYPSGRQASAVLPLLDMAQRQHQGWLPRAAMDTVANILKMPPIRVYEIATFYSMFNLAPVGKYLLQICTTTPCALRGAQDLVAVCKQRKMEDSCISLDGNFTFKEVECLGACVNAPVVQINDDYYEDLNAASFDALLEAFQQGKHMTGGSALGRKGAGPCQDQTNPSLDLLLKSVQEK